MSARRFVCAVHNAVASSDASDLEQLAHEYHIVPDGELKWNPIDFSSSPDKLEQVRVKFRNLLESGGMFMFRYHDASAMKRAAAAKKQKPAKGKALQKSLIQWIERTLDSPLENGFVEGLKSGVVLCKLVNKIAKDNDIKPKKGKRLIRKIKNSKMKFDMLENCQAFVEALRTTFKIRQSSTPSPNDIVNGKNVRQLEICLQTFHRKFGKKDDDEEKKEEKTKKVVKKTVKKDTIPDGYVYAELPIPRPRAAEVYAAMAHEGPISKNDTPSKSADVFKDLVRKLPQKEWNQELENYVERCHHEYSAKLKALESVIHDHAVMAVIRLQDPVVNDAIKPPKWGDSVILFSPPSAHSLDDAALKQPSTLGPIEKFLQEAKPPVLLGANVHVEGTTAAQGDKDSLHFVRVTNKLFLHTVKIKPSKK